MGITIQPEEFDESKHYKKRKKRNDRFSIFDGHRLYSGVHLLIPYTGKLLLGRDFLQEYYIHMGFQQPFAYKTLMEFVFEEGIPLDAIDHSDTAEELRKTIDLQDSRWALGIKSVSQFVNDCFSLDYKAKAWWLSG